MALDTISYTLLTSTAGITRVTPSIFPKDTVLPAAVYEVTSISSAFTTLSGDTGVYRGTVDVDIAAKTLSEVNTESEKIINNLIGFCGSVGTSSVYNIELLDVNTLYDEDVEVYVKQLSLSILYKK